MPVGSTLKVIRMGLVMAALGLSLSACGVRGSLDPPPDAKATGTAKSAEARDPGPNSEAPRKKHEGFILDPLLR
jgi:predicted small lipoprotein YifL